MGLLASALQALAIACMAFGTAILIFGLCCLVEMWREHLGRKL